MKRKILNWIFIFMSAIGSFSCQKSPINGPLDGQWQVVEIMPAPEEIIISEKLYYNFALHVCMLTYYDGWFLSANMDYDGKTMTLDFPYASSEEDFLILKQYGITSNPITFQVKFENKNSLVMTNHETTVYLKKL